MPSKILAAVTALAAMLLQQVAAQTCQTIAPSVNVTTMEGYQAKLIMKGLKSPRSLIFDKEGNLVVIEQRVGVRYIKFAAGNEPCMESSKLILNDTSVSVLRLLLNAIEVYVYAALALVRCYTCFFLALDRKGRQIHQKRDPKEHLE